MSVTSALPPVSGLEGCVYDQGEIPSILTVGEYTLYPMEYCTEEEIAKVFTKICQRGNPVLQGRPAADLILLGKAMYRKAKVLHAGQVAMHKGQVVAIGFSWDHAEGGVWKDSGLEMPESLAAHASCGKAAFDSLQKRGDTWFGGFFGVLPPHGVELFGYLAVSSFLMGEALGFEDAFQFTLLPTLDKRQGGVFSKYGDEEDNLNWDVKFSEIAARLGGAVGDELRELDGNINLSRTKMSFVLGEEWMGRAAKTVRLPTSQSIREPAMQMTTNHLNWLKRQPQQAPQQSPKMIPSRL
jgi:hypothetical protein